MTKKTHAYVKVEVELSQGRLIDNWWRYDVTACGIRRQEDDFHEDAAESLESITCIKCQRAVNKGLR